MSLALEKFAYGFSLVGYKDEGIYKQEAWAVAQLSP